MAGRPYRQLRRLEDLHLDEAFTSDELLTAILSLGGHDPGPNRSHHHLTLILHHCLGYPTPYTKRTYKPPPQRAPTAKEYRAQWEQRQQRKKERAETARLNRRRTVK